MARNGARRRTCKLFTLLTAVLPQLTRAGLSDRRFGSGRPTGAIRHVAALTILFMAATRNNGCAAMVGRVTADDGLPRLRLLRFFHRSDLRHIET
jgi:hypothetical protein